MVAQRNIILEDTLIRTTGIGPLHYPKYTELWWGYSFMYSLLEYHKSQDQVRT